MGAGLVKVKRRINSVQSTYKVTKAMQLIASSKFVRKKKLMDNTVNYAAYLSSILSSCMEGLDKQTVLDLSPLLAPNKKSLDKGNLYIVVTSSLGLCGGYNLALIKFALPYIKKEDKILVIGEKGLVKFTQEGLVCDDEDVSVLEKFKFPDAKKLTQQITGFYTDGLYKNIYLVYTRFKNALTFIPTLEKILPMDETPQAKPGEETKKFTFAYPPDFYPNKERVLTLLIPKVLDTVFFERLNEASCCEEGARRNAMENASDNAEDLQKSLTVAYNKARQAEITNQINEIMSGRLADSDNEE